MELLPTTEFLVVANRSHLHLKVHQFKTPSLDSFFPPFKTLLLKNTKEYRSRDEEICLSWTKTYQLASCVVSLQETVRA